MKVPLPLTLPLALVALICSTFADTDNTNRPTHHATKRDHGTYDYYVLHHDPVSTVPLSDILRSLGLELVDSVGQLPDHWLLRIPRNHEELQKRHTYERLDALTRRSSPKGWDQELERIAGAVKHLSLQTLRQRVKRTSEVQRSSQPIDWLAMNSSTVADREGIQDPIFSDQWHLVNDENPVHMVNAAPVWDMGIHGEGVISAMVDDGLDYESDDLADNFDAVNSYDFNLHVDLPKPMLFDDHHGTRCAGQIAAVKNDVCGVGIAYNSKVAGVRILSGPISDADEAAALNYGYQNTSIYSCSWGPADDGRSMEGPGYLIQKTFVNGIENGRGGKGSIFVFASGNGASRDDQCNFDGYTNSIYSVTVAAIDYKGLHPYYSEACAANMVVTYSSGGGRHIVTTDVGKDKCSSSHGGTSAAAPNAVGIFALALSARPDLTWRDIQHLCVRTAKIVNPDDPDWEDTAAGRRFSYKYGYGSLDAFAYVQAAQNWQLMKPQAWLHTDHIQLSNGVMTAEGEMSGGAPIAAGGVASSVMITADMLRAANFEQLEHITVRVWIQHTRRGDVEVELTSPNGVKSVLAAWRRYDTDASGFPGWKFMTVKHWDENPIGTWIIRVSDQGIPDNTGSFLGWTMSLWGSAIDAGKAEKFILADPDVPFPPPPDTGDAPLPSQSPTTSKSYPKPTEHLPGDHGAAEGEATRPAFSSAQSDIVEATASAPTTSASESLAPAPDEGWFPGMYKLVSNSKWVFGAASVVVVFGVGMGAFFLWRRRKARQGQYRSLTDSDVPMNSIERGKRTTGTRELYDAFGAVSDDDDDFVDEETGLRQPLAENAAAFHSGFLDDDEPGTSHIPQPIYTDEPTVSDRQRELSSTVMHPGEQSESSSADESWEHADPS